MQFGILDHMYHVIHKEKRCVFVMLCSLAFLHRLRWEAGRPITHPEQYITCNIVPDIIVYLHLH